MKAFLELLASFFGKKKEVPISPELQAYVEDNAKAQKESLQRPLIREIEFKSDSPRLKREFSELETKNPDLKELLEDLNLFTNQEFGKNLVITMIYRTDSEQDFLYADSAKYQRRKFKSPHQFFQGVDLRSRTFTSAEIVQIEGYLNSKWNALNYYGWTAKNHNVSHGVHFHVQFIWK